MELFRSILVIIRIERKKGTQNENISFMNYIGIDDKTDFIFTEIRRIKCFVHRWNRLAIESMSNLT